MFLLLSRVAKKDSCLLLCLLVLLTLFALVIPASARVRQNKHNILVLQSYHEGFAWTSDSIKELRSVFSGSPERIEIYTEYLDMKRFPSTGIESYYYDLFKAKYVGTNFDLIIAFDDYAVSFVSDYQNVLFPDTPVLVCEIGNIQESFISNGRGVTGIFVNLNLKSILDLIAIFHPSVTDIYTISDNTPIGVYASGEINQIKDIYKEKFQIHELHDLSSDVLVRYLRNLPDKSVVLLLSFFNDSTGKQFDAKDIFQLIGTSCNVPVYTVLEEYVYNGAVGGVVFNYEQYYRKIAQTALDVLGGKPVETIPVLTQTADKFLFDYKKLKRLHVPKDKIPANSVIINKPNFYRDKDVPILFASIIILSIVLFCLVFLWISSMKVKKAKRELLVFKKFAQGSGQGLVMVDFNYNISFLNPALCKMLSLDTPELYIGKNFLDFYPPEIRRFFQNKVIPSMLEQSVWTGELSMISSQGKVISTLESCFVIYDDNNIPLCFGSVVSETTKMKKTERELSLFKSISDSANYGSVITDIEGQIVYVNNYMASVHGYTVEELKDNNLSVFFSEKDLSFAEDFFRESFKKGNFSVKEIFHVRKDGEEFPMIMNGVLIQDSEGANPLVGINAVDISEHKKLLAALMKKQKLESISLLAGGIAHDFNNLLFSILGNISLVMTKITNKDLLNKLAQAETAAEQARYLSQQLLTFAKGGVPLKQTTILADIIQETVKFTLKGSNIKPVLKLSESLLPVEVDHTQISQVIHNIVLNSYQAMPEGGEIEVESENIEIDENNKRVPVANGKYLLITIKDQGTGIPEENIDKVFDPYFTTRNKSVGLGMTICYSIIKKHDGYIDIESKQGEGTRVYVYLPASKNPVKKRSGPVEKKEKKNANILIMEGDELVKSILGDFLKSIKYKYQFVKNSDEAVAEYKKYLRSDCPFDAVFMDLTIAGNKSPIDTLKELKQIDKNVKAILSSGYTNDPVVVHYKENGFASFLGKPFSINELRNILKEIL